MEGRISGAGWRRKQDSINGSGGNAALFRAYSAGAYNVEADSFAANASLAPRRQPARLARRCRNWFSVPKTLPIRILADQVVLPPRGMVEIERRAGFAHRARRVTFRVTGYVLRFENAITVQAEHIISQ